MPQRERQPNNDMMRIDSEDRPSPKLFIDDISELARDFLSRGTASLTIEQTSGLTAELNAAYTPRIIAKRANEFTAPAMPKVSDDKIRTKPSISFRLTRSTNLPAIRPVKANGTVQTRPTSNPYHFFIYG